MAIERRAEAAWVESKEYWEIKVQKNGTRKSFRSSVKGRKGKHEAEAKADKWLATGTVEMRFSEAWDSFLKWHKSHNGTSNYKKHESYGRLYIIPRLKLKRLSAIKANDWQSCIDAGANHGLSRRSCENIRASITAFLRYARKERWEFVRLEDGDLHIPNKAKPKKPKIILQPSDVQTLFSDPYIIHYGKKKHAHWIFAWRMYVVSGMRRGELCGLRNEDVDDKYISIHRNINTENETTFGKNDNARRSFLITPSMRSVLNDQAEYLKQQGIVSEWVFPDEFGECSDPNKVYDRWCTYREQHGMLSSIHGLRHTFVSINKSDMPSELLKMVVGHSEDMDTTGVYGHEIEGDKERAANIMEDNFNRVLAYSSNKSN